MDQAAFNVATATNEKLVSTKTTLVSMGLPTIEIDNEIAKRAALSAAVTPAVIKLETDEQYKKMTKGNLKALNKGFGDLVDMNQDIIEITSIKMQTSKASGNRMAVIKKFQSIATGKKYDRNVYLSPNQMYFLAARAGKLFSNGVAVNEEQLESAPDEQVLEIVSTDFTVKAKVVANDNRWDFDRKTL